MDDHTYAIKILVAFNEGKTIECYDEDEDKWFTNSFGEGDGDAIVYSTLYKLNDPERFRIKL